MTALLVLIGFTLVGATALAVFLAPPEPAEPSRLDRLDGVGRGRR